MDKKTNIVVDGVRYVREDSIPTQAKAKTLKGKPYVIVRTYSAGVFAGYLAKRTGKEATLLNARRIWHWQGAASLSQLSVDGTSKPENCKFPVAVPKVELTEAIEVLECSEKARKSIESVPEWKM